MAGEVADGIHVHPLHSTQYLQNRLLPEVARGAAGAGRDPAAVDLIVPVFAVPGDTPEERAPLLQRARQQIAFYGSTRNYAFQFDDLGFAGTSARLNDRLKAGDTEGMAAVITDEMLEHFSVVALWDDMADTLLRRYEGIAHRLVMYLAEDSLRADPAHLARWGEIARAVSAG
jgi:alkanesulfonate monooxygenase SsuD/methylene tetrahydromethanopterin reductase-like flavin-dependent oxidoreductase (luciferase family)